MRPKKKIFVFMCLRGDSLFDVGRLSALAKMSAQMRPNRKYRDEVIESRAQRPADVRSFVYVILAMPDQAKSVA